MGISLTPPRRCGRLPAPSKGAPQGATGARGFASPAGVFLRGGQCVAKPGAAGPAPTDPRGAVPARLPGVVTWAGADACVTVDLARDRGDLALYNLHPTTPAAGPEGCSRIGRH